MALSILPDEVSLNILYHLGGDEPTTLSLFRTSKHLRALLTENEPRIAYTIAQKSRIGPVRFLLEATAPTRLPPSFVWLHSGYARGSAIESLVDALEIAHLYENSAIFRPGRPLVLADRGDLRRYIMTMLLAVELCSMSGTTCLDIRRWIHLSPRWAVGFAYLSQDLIHHVVKMLHLCVKGQDAVMWGTPEAADAWCALVRVDIRAGDAGYLTGVLCGGMLFSGSRGIVDILSATYESYDQFVAVAKCRLYGDQLGCTLTNVSLQTLHAKFWNIYNAIWDEYEDKDEDDAEASAKWYIIQNDVHEWQQAVPDDEAWARLIHDNEWWKIMKLDPAQLRSIEYPGRIGMTPGESGSQLGEVSQFYREP